MADKKGNSAGNIEVKLKDVRLSFAHIFRAQETKNDDGTTSKTFNCSFLLDKESADGKKNIQAMRKAINEAAAAKWGKNIPKLKPEKLCMRDGDNEEWDGYEGHMYVSARSPKRPVIVDRDRSPLSEDDGKPYSGCYVDAIVRVWCQDNNHGKRVNASLEGIQFRKDGEAFGAAPIDADEAFDDLSDGDDGFGGGEDDDDSGGGLI